MRCGDRRVRRDGHRCPGLFRGRVPERGLRQSHRHSGSYSTIEENRVYHNTGTGISLDDDGTVRANVVFSNATGISGQTSYYDFAGQVRNNLVYANTNTGIRITDGSGAEVVNNTVYQELGDAVRLEGGYSDGVTLRNNILWVQRATIFPSRPTLSVALPATTICCTPRVRAKSPGGKRQLGPR